MKMPQEVKELLSKVPEIMLGLAKEAVIFAEKMTEASTSITEALKEMYVDEE